MRRGQRAFVIVAVAVVAVAAVIYFFPGSPSDESGPAKLSGQEIEIRPARRKSSRRDPRRGQYEPASRPRPKDKTLDEIWQVIYLDGKRIGYSRTKFAQESKGNAVRIRTTSEMHLTVLRFGQKTRMSAVTRTLEDADGDLISFETESGTGRGKTRMTGKRQDQYMLVETTANGRTSHRYHEWRPGIKSPTYQDRLVRTYPMKPREIRRFETFMPDLGRTTEVKLSAEDYRPKKLYDGSIKKLLRIRMTQSVSPTEAVFTYLDEKGRPVLSESEFAGTPMVQYIVSSAEALKSIQGEELDIGVKTILRTTALLQAEKRDCIVYRIFMTGDDPAKYVAANDRQTVKRINDKTIELTVKRSTVPKRVAYVRTAKEYTQPSRYLDSRDERVREHARRAAGYQTDPIRIAVRMERYVRDTLKDKNFSTALGTASQVARSLSGDCTEHAVLLAAMLRVRGIPSRIVIGFVYDERVSGFIAHMWTEARLGEKWIPFDATRGQGQISPAHIKLADASFADDSDAPITSFLPLMNVIGKWRIEIHDSGNVPGQGRQPKRTQQNAIRTNAIRKLKFPFRRK